jgi:Zn/Cd-binding protein ZinT
VKTRYWTSDWESVYKFVLENNMPELFEKRLNQSVIKELVEEDADFALPGLNSDSEYVITVRKK